MDKITIINYQMGNIGSVAKKIKRIGYEPVITSNSKDIQKANKLILPGVGHFASAVDKLKNTGIWEALNISVIQNKTPILGICLGMQLMAKHSEEGNCEGLGWIDADVIRFKVSNTTVFKIPHVGWNTLVKENHPALFEGINNFDEFYFVHSYHVKCNDKNNVIANTNYNINFHSAFQKENIFGVQFHPEKSHDIGEKLLQNFLKL